MRDFSLRRFLVPPILLLLSALTCGVVSAEQLVLVGQPASDATWQSSTEEGVLEFRVGETVHQVPREKLVRWSTPPANIGRGEAILVDGSRLVLADSWGGTFALQLVDDTVTLATNRLGDVQVSPAQLRAALLNAPADALRRTKLLDKLLSDAPDRRPDLSHQRRRPLRPRVQDRLPVVGWRSGGRLFVGGRDPAGGTAHQTSRGDSLGR
ncbi:MAG: hypothetical protein IH898_10260 [Planctomycetes bacterium]|nr:hypothetical protein [Planctomycetota bacterium]